MRANLRYEKNQKREDVKSHHYIISFDPRDGTDNGLTVDRAQELGEQFCKEHFPGHQALVCTHPDGITTAAISMCISSSTPCGFMKPPTRAAPPASGTPGGHDGAGERGVGGKERAACP